MLGGESICYLVVSFVKRVRVDLDYWHQVERPISKMTSDMFGSARPVHSTTRCSLPHLLQCLIQPPQGQRHSSPRSPPPASLQAPTEGFKPPTRSAEWDSKAGVSGASDFVWPM